MYTITPEMIDEMRSTFSYDEEAGILTRIKKSGPNTKVGTEAGCLDKSGYRFVRFLGKSHSSHRVIWSMFYREPPPALIDHINGIKTDNRIGNLRAANNSINTQNLKGPRVDNKLGMLGVRARGGKFEARIMVNGRAVHIGTFSTAEKASSAYLDHKRSLHIGGTL